jgi:hypothetical protein
MKLKNKKKAKNLCNWLEQFVKSSTKIETQTSAMGIDIFKAIPYRKR